jgi:hypothetical protein
MNRHKRVFPDAGVSESIGFILIFSIVIAGISIVTLYGYPILLQQQVNTNEQIMEKNMIVLQNDLKNIAYKMIPYTDTSMKVDGGALSVYNMTYNPGGSSNFSIYDSQSCMGTSAKPYIFSPGNLLYESTSAQTDLSLENGAVVKNMLAEQGSSMLATPRWFYDGTTNTAVIYLIGFNSTTLMGFSGVGDVQMQLTGNNYTACPLTKVDVRYQPNANLNYATAWNTYFTNSLGMTPDGSTGYYTFAAGTPVNLIVKTYQIQITPLG